MPASSPHSRGFTLLELLVAMTIFGIIGALAMGGLNAVMRQEKVARTQLERLHDVQRAVRILSSDFAQLNPRRIRDALGTCEAALVAPCDVSHPVCLSHDGWANPFGRFARGTLQRTQYRLDDGKLIREYWRVMDRTLANEPRSEVLLDQVESFEVSFPPKAPQGAEAWSSQWPALGQGKNSCESAELPRAVRIFLQLRDWGDIERVVEVVQ
ncbi:MAG: type II secretion system minor pseudopilin GspJ [Gammaproteobacteria bacterium]|nr:MAG: type II secretion system minor pseudopilin GspJ [Gammaproteobacteria bacterium]